MPSVVLSGRASDLTLQRFNHLTTRSATSYTPEPQAAPACIGERTLTEDNEGNKAWSWVLQPLRYLRFLLFRSEIIQTAAKPFVPIRVTRVLLLVGGNLWQLRREQAFLFFLVQRQSRGRDDLRGDPQIFTEGNEGNKARSWVWKIFAILASFSSIISNRERIFTEASEGNKGCDWI